MKKQHVVLGEFKIPVAIVAILIAGAVSPAAPVAALAQVEEEAGQEWTKDGEDGAALPEMVVEATNEVRQKIDKGTFSFELDAAAVDSFYSAMDFDALEVSPVSGLQPHLNNLETLNSDQPPHMWIQELARTPVARFFPSDPEGHKIKNWSLAVTDYRGAPFKTYSGKGNPPESLVWDGISDGGETLEVGYPYSYVFRITDKGTNSYSYAGVSFRIPALDYRQDGDRVLELAGGELFSRLESKLSHQGENWLTRVADEIRRHPYSPVRVVLTAEDKNTADARTAVVAQYLAESMILPLEQIETETIVRSDLKVEMDGSIAVIIEHVED